jgi:glutathione synthase/RimK-type ligase-like ATP-grasp enzyme
MPDLLLLVGDPAKARNDNHRRFERGFREAGWCVTVADHDALEVRRSRLVVGDRDPASFDLIWPLGFGRYATFFDRMQMLSQLQGTRFVTAPDVMVSLHGKHRWLDAMPETHTSTNAKYLHEVVSSGGDWVIKPTAGSYGRQVRLFRAGEATIEDVARLCRELDGGYLMAQRLIPEIAAGEKRTLVAGGTILGTYLRRPGQGITSNLAAGGSSAPACLTEAEVDLVEPIARELAVLGAGYAAVDTVFPYLMEVNVANPGGLETIEGLGGGDLTTLAVQSIVAWALDASMSSRQR